MEKTTSLPKNKIKLLKKCFSSVIIPKKILKTPEKEYIFGATCASILVTREYNKLLIFSKQLQGNEIRWTDYQSLAYLIVIRMTHLIYLNASWSLSYMSTGAFPPDVMRCRKLFLYSVISNYLSYITFADERNSARAGAEKYLFGGYSRRRAGTISTISTRK